MFIILNSIALDLVSYLVRGLVPRTSFPDRRL